MKNSFIIFFFLSVSLLTFDISHVHAQQTTQEWVQRFTWNNYANGNSFSYAISMQNENLLECQPIYLNLIVKNLDNSEDSLVAIDFTTDLVLTDLNNGKVISPSVILEYSSYSHERFQPDEEKLFPTDLQGDYGKVALDSVKNKHGAWGGVYPHLPVGKYSIYFNNGLGSSNVVSFEVVKPVDQDLTDLNILKDAFAALISGPRKQIDKFYDFLVNHPNSNYYELALTQYSGGLLSNHYSPDDYDNLMGISEQWFVKNADSELAKQIVRALGAVFKTTFSNTKEKVITFLNKTIVDHPNSVAGRWSQRYLDIIKKNK